MVPRTTLACVVFVLSLLLYHQQADDDYLLTYLLLNRFGQRSEVKVKVMTRPNGGGMNFDSVALWLTCLETLGEK